MDISSNVETIKNNENNGLPGTAQLRKVTSYMSSMELLELAVAYTREGDDKKLWSLLSRVYTDDKGFNDIVDGDKMAMRAAVDAIMASPVPAEYKLQLFTSFKLPLDMVPADEDIALLAENCNKKRVNILAYFIVAYNLETLLYKYVVGQRDIFKIVAKKIGDKRLVALYEYIILNENKEFITGAVRMMANEKINICYKDTSDIKKLTEVVFESKEVFFTTKLLFCQAFSVPRSVVLTLGRELDKVIKISINYEERITKDFVKLYDLRFDCSDNALCNYYLSNKKATKEKVLVQKFAAHLVRIEDAEEKKKLLRKAFKRGGAFRMYAGCMQDGFVDEDKQKRFHYSDEDIEWVKGLPGLK